MTDPLALDALSATGATFAGAPVKAVILVLDDDRRARLDLPMAKRPKDWTRTKPGRAILDALAVGGSMKGATVAKSAGYPYTGSFREVLAGLVEAGEVIRDDEEGYCIAVVSEKTKRT